jgi:hypothetical protein
MTARRHRPCRHHRFARPDAEHHRGRTAAQQEKEAMTKKSMTQHPPEIATKQICHEAISHCVEYLKNTERDWDDVNPSVQTLRMLVHIVERVRDRDAVLAYRRDSGLLPFDNPADNWLLAAVAKLIGAA